MILDKARIGAKEVDEVNNLRAQVKMDGDARTKDFEFRSLECPVCAGGVSVLGRMAE